MSVNDWHSPNQGALGFVLAPDDTGGAETNSPTLLVLINRDADALSFRLPSGSWRQLCDSSANTPFAPLQLENTSSVAARSVQLLAQE
jgi:pullulanase/glycogen debranching enzyme